MVVLGVDGERGLEEWEAAIRQRGMGCEAFAEPDMGGQKTSLASFPTEDGGVFGELSLL